MGKPYNLTGMRFGRLTVLSQAAHNDRKQTMWNCACDCGGYAVVLGYNLTKGLTKSCGCYHKERQIENKLIHGEYRTRLYGIWANMKTRCFNPNATEYDNYGGRGITVCEEWKDNYLAFRDWAMTHGYADNLSIDRIDNNKGYSPQNCKWATAGEQNLNKRNLRLLTYNGETHCMTEWARITNLCEGTLRHRIDTLGWSLEKALTTPSGGKHGRTKSLLSF